MPIVTIELLEGRTIQEKKQLVEGITQVISNLGIPPHAVRIILRDMPKYNYAIGGKLASEEFPGT